MSTAKLNECPRCGNPNLHDRWSSKGGRRLEQYCEAEIEEPDEDFEIRDNGYGGTMYVCGWVGEPRTPETIPIPLMRLAWAADRGSEIEVFDRYGHTLASWSPHTNNPLAEIEAELRRGLTDDDAGPYTAVYWPGSVRRGRIYKGCPPVWVNQPPAKRFVPRRDTFVQDTPRQQAAALIQSVQGDLANASWPAAVRCRDLLAQVQEILQFMPDGQWQKERE